MTALKISERIGHAVKPKAKAPVLNRYTSLPALLHLLRYKQITLLSPGSWEDRNDAFFMGQYKKRQKYGSVLALCFSEAEETFHHWRVFTHGSDGVCIEFKRDEILATFAAISNIRKGPVKYKQIRELTSFHPSVDELPFLKRQPYKDEKEFRIVYFDADEDIESRAFTFDLSCIQEIKLNPWMPRALVAAVRETIKSIDGCQRIKVYKTTLLENEQWKRCAI